VRFDSSVDDLSPGNSPPETVQNKPRFRSIPAAIFIDYENIFFGLSSCNETPPSYALPRVLMKALESALNHRRLDLRVRRAYANWTMPPLVESSSQDMVLRAGYQTIHTLGKSGSNAAEIHLMVEMIAEMAMHSNRYKYCVIVTGDQDLVPAVRKLKELGTYRVLVVSAVGNLAKALRVEAHESVILDHYYQNALRRFSKEMELPDNGTPPLP
jgi:hypothetical protein